MKNIEQNTEILIIGGSLGGVAAALAAARLGRRVILTEEADWIGGQLTSQSVPPDEHAWIEETGCTASYRRLRNNIRKYYYDAYPLNSDARSNPLLNPGQGSVSKLCHEPRVSLAVIEQMLAPFSSARQIQVLTGFRPVSAETDSDRVRSVTLEKVNSGDKLTISAAYVLDATELGDLLPLVHAEHVLGAESQAQTGELHARVDEPDPIEQQPFSWCFAMDYIDGDDFTIEKPVEYDFWRNYQADFWPDKLLSWTYSEPEDLSTVTRPIFAGPRESSQNIDLWHFRRILWTGHYQPGTFQSDIVVVNWPQIDYWLSPLAGVPPEEAARNLERSKQLSLSMFYWMQTEAPRLGGGYGYRGLRLRGDVTGTLDGLAMAPYIRESRRIQAEFTVLEQHVGVEARDGLVGAEKFFDSVGVGSYRIDLHPTYRRNYIDISNWPFQIPLGALLPVRLENFLPACKNLGVTHITNGCYRLHPVEWNIGETAGALAAFCLEKDLVPRQVRQDPVLLADFQRLLTDTLGFQLEWQDEIRATARVKVNPLGI
jgi:hypothetical protein